jgi:hypothetical protein
MRRLFLVVVAVAAGCGSTVSVGNNVPQGVISGVLLDASTRLPLPMAAVQVIAGEAIKDATSNDQGVFTVRDVPAGPVILTFSAMGFRTATFQVFLNGAVGNFPVSNPQLTVGPIGLVKNSGVFLVRLVDQNGAPAANIRAIARPQVMYVDFSSGFANPTGNYEVSATSGADGLVTFNEVPDYSTFGDSIGDNLIVYVPPTLVMGTDQYNFLGVAQSFNAAAGGGTIPTIALAGPRTALTVLDSNIEYLRPDAFPTQMGSAPVLPNTGPITIAFNQAIDPKSVRVSFTDEDGVLLSTMANPNVAGNLLTISPMGTMLPAGRKLALSLRAAALGSSESSGSTPNVRREIVRVVPFFTRPMAAALTAIAKVDSTIAAPLTINLDFSEAIGEGFAPPTPTTVPCVAFYEGADLDGSSETYTAEFNATTSQLRCHGESLPAPVLDITSITSREGGAGGSTGFTSRWRIVLGDVLGGPGGNNGCKPAASCPAHPAVNSRARMIFSKAASKGRIVRRASGDVLDDSTSFMIQ